MPYIEKLRYLCQCSRTVGQQDGTDISALTLLFCFTYALLREEIKTTSELQECYAPLDTPYKV